MMIATMPVQDPQKPILLESHWITMSNALSRERLERAVQLFDTVWQPRMGTLRAHLDRDERHEIGELCHQLAGAAGNLGLIRLEKMARQWMAAMKDRSTVLADMKEALDQLTQLQQESADQLREKMARRI